MDQYAVSYFNLYLLSEAYRKAGTTKTKSGFRDGRTLTHTSKFCQAVLKLHTFTKEILTDVIVEAALVAAPFCRNTL